MCIENTPFTNLDQYPNFEFYSTKEVEDRIVKKYTGQDWEKKRVLKNEYEWLKEAPLYLNYHFPGLLQGVIHFHDDENGVELHLSKPNRRSLAQEILSGNIDDVQAVKYLESSIFILCEYIYPIHTEEREFSGQHPIMELNNFLKKTNLFDNLYRPESKSYDDWLMKMFLNIKKNIVNGIVCPSISDVLNYIKNKNIYIKPATTLHTIHGNFYLDNILVEPGTKTLTEWITLINPKNNDQQWLYPDHFLGFPVIDFSSMMLNLESYWDEINYGGFEFEMGSMSVNGILNFKINNNYSDVYEKGLQFLSSKRSYFAALQGVSVEEFTIITLCTEWLQMFNKLFELDRTNSENYDRSFVLMGILALLGKRVLDSIQNIDEFFFPEKRLEIK